MPLQRAGKRQKELEKLLLEFGEMDIDLCVETEVRARDVIDLMNKQLAVLSYLALNVRDCLFLLNRQNPDLAPEDAELPVIGQRVTPESPGEGTETDPGTETGQTETEPSGEEDKKTNDW